MAIKHMKYLQTQAPGKTATTDSSADADSTDRPPMTQQVESFRVGYHECLSETMHFLVEREGMYAGDSLCVRLMNHLQRHYERINRGTPLGRPERSSSSSAATGTSSGASSSGYVANGSSNSGSDTGVSANSSEVNLPVDSDYGSTRAESDHRVPIIGLQQAKTEHADLISSHEQGQYKFKASIQQRFSHQTDDLRQKDDLRHREDLRQREDHRSHRTPETPEKRMRLESPLELIVNQRRGSGYPFQNPFHHETRDAKSPLLDQEPDVKLQPRFDPSQFSPAATTTSPSFKFVRDIKVARSPSPAVSTSSHPAPTANVPIFALHPKGTFYIPLTVDYSVVSPYMLLYPDPETPTQMHPVTISVNFCGPLQMAMKQELPTTQPQQQAAAEVMPSTSVARHLRQSVAEYAPSWRERIDQVMIERGSYRNQVEATETFGRGEAKSKM